MGAYVTKFMNEVVGGLPSVTLKTECPLVALVQDPTTKAVLGGIYNDGKNDVRVQANKGVIMTCGGFESNPDMMANYFSQPTVTPIAAAAEHRRRPPHLRPAERRRVAHESRRRGLLAPSASSTIRDGASTTARAARSRTSALP